MTQQDTTAKTLRVDLKTEIPYWLVILPCIFIFGVIKEPDFFSAWPLMLILTVFLISYSVLTFRHTVIDVGTVQGQVILTETNLIKKKRVKSYPLRELQFTYKTGKPGLYHRTVNICRLYLKDKEIATIIPDHDGWTDDTVNDLAKGLVALGVPQKFMGYSGKDAEINGL